MRALSKADLKPSRANMHGAASLWKEKQTLSLPPTCTQLVLCEKGKFALDGEFSKNAPYKQKIIFHLKSIGKMSKKNGCHRRPLQATLRTSYQDMHSAASLGEKDRPSPSLYMHTLSSV